MDRLRGRGGQGLIEYLILVALMAVATIGVVRALNYVVQVQFGNVIRTVEGNNHKIQTRSFDESTIHKRDLSDFMKGGASRGRTEP